jgi:predicted transcriptional regulator
LRNRGSFEIKMTVLGIVQKEKKPTLIMYGANICWRSTQRVLGELAESGLIRAFDADSGVRARDGRSRYFYELTPKGEKVLAGYVQLNRALEEP